MSTSARDRFDRKRKIGGPDQCWLWLAGKTSKGYGDFRDEDGRSIGAHVFVFREIHGWTPPHVMHGCNNKLCTNPGHLFAGNAKANTIMAIHDGLLVRKLAMTDIPVIRSLRRAGHRARDIAGRYDVTASMVYRIINGTRWGHVPDLLAA